MHTRQASEEKEAVVAAGVQALVAEKEAIMNELKEILEWQKSMIEGNPDGQTRRMTHNRAPAMKFELPKDVEYT